MDQYISAGIRIKLTFVSSLEVEILPFSLYSRRCAVSCEMRSTQPIIPLDRPLVTQTKSPVEKALRTLYQETTSIPSFEARSTSKCEDLTAAIVASFSDEETMTGSPSSKIHSSGHGNLVPVRAGCEASLNNSNIRPGIPAGLRDSECKSNVSWSSPWSKTRPREV